MKLPPGLTPIEDDGKLPEGLTPIQEVSDSLPPGLTPIAESETPSTSTPTVAGPAAPESSVLRRAIGDPLVAAAKGIVGFPQGLVGLADIPTFGLVGKGLEMAGVDFKGTQEAIGGLYSPEAKEAQRKVQAAPGILGTVSEAVKNPSTIVTGAIESAPSMFGGGAIAKGALRAIPALGRAVAAGRAVGATESAVAAGQAAGATAGAIGEGLITAGQNLEQVREETPGGMLTPAQVGLNVASGAITGMIGRYSGGLANKMGFADVDTLMASGLPNVTKLNFVKSVLGGMVQEGLLEEFPQSYQEQVAQNLSLGKPWDEGTGEAAAMGGLIGGVMGGGANVKNQMDQRKYVQAVDNARVEQNRQTAEVSAQRQEIYGLAVEGGLTPEQALQVATSKTPEMDLYRTITEIEQAQEKSDIERKASENALLQTLLRIKTAREEEERQKTDSAETAQASAEMESSQLRYPDVSQQVTDPRFRLYTDAGYDRSAAIEMVRKDQEQDTVDANAAGQHVESRSLKIARQADLQSQESPGGVQPKPLVGSLQSVSPQPGAPSSSSPEQPKGQAPSPATDAGATGETTSGKKFTHATVAREYFFDSGAGAMQSTGYLFNALAGTFPRAANGLMRVLTKYSSEISSTNDDIRTISQTDSWQNIREEIISEIESAYGSNRSEARSILDEMLNNPTGVPVRTGKRLQERADALEAKSQQTAEPISPPAQVPTKQQARPETGKATDAKAGVISNVEKVREKSKQLKGVQDAGKIEGAATVGKQSGGTQGAGQEGSAGVERGQQGNAPAGTRKGPQPQGAGADANAQADGNAGQVKPPELMTPEEFTESLPIAKGVYPEQRRRQGARMVRLDENNNMLPLDRDAGVIVNTHEHGKAIYEAAETRKPLSASAVDAYGIKLPPGYVREGDRYVFKPQPPQASVEPTEKASSPGTPNAGVEAVSSESPPASTAPAASSTVAPEPDAKVDTISGRMDLREFESKGYSPEEVTRKNWIDLQRAERRRIGQQEGGDNRNAPWSEYEEYHRQAVKDAVARGDEVDERVLADYPDIKPAGRGAEGEKSVAKQPWQMTASEFEQAVKRGKIVKSTGKTVPGEESAKTPLRMGELNGYSPDDIAHFYAKRRGYPDSVTSKYDPIVEGRKELVEDALREGKPVPGEVIDELGAKMRPANASERVAAIRKKAEGVGKPATTPVETPSTEVESANGFDAYGKQVSVGDIVRYNPPNRPEEAPKDARLRGKVTRIDEGKMDLIVWDPDIGTMDDVGRRVSLVDSGSISVENVEAKPDTAKEPSASLSGNEKRVMDWFTANPGKSVKAFLDETEMPIPAARESIASLVSSGRMDSSETVANADDVHTGVKLWESGKKRAEGTDSRTAGASKTVKEPPMSESDRQEMQEARDAAPVIAALKAIPEVSGVGRDKAGISIRGGALFDKAIGGRFTDSQLKAARRALIRDNAHVNVVNSVETALPAEPATAAEPAQNAWDASTALLKRAQTEPITAAEAQAAYARLKAERAMTQQIIRAKLDADPRFSRKRKATKDEIAQKAVADRLQRFANLTSDGFTWMPHAETPEQAADRHVAALTDEAIKAKFEERQKESAEKRKALENPETLDEYRTFVIYKGDDALTPEQRAKYDALRAEAGMSARESQQIEKKGTVGQVEGAAQVPMEIVERPHEKRGHNVFIVTMGERVGTDTFKELAQKARRLGGNWSRAWKPTDSPAGFVFNDKASAEKFMALREGDVSKSEDVAAAKEETREAAADRLTAMADKMESDGNESLGRDRLANTARRARMADSAEAEAAAKVAMARTLRNIAEAVRDGRAKFLKNVKTRTQVETLAFLVRDGRYRHIEHVRKELMANYVENHWQEYKRGTYTSDKEARRSAEHNASSAVNMDIRKLEEQPVSTEDVPFVKYPTPQLWGDHIGSLIRDIQGKPGGKMLAMRLRKYEGKREGMTDIPREIAQTLLSKFPKEAGMHNLERTLGDMKRLEAMNITNDAELRAALREYLEYKGEKPAENKAQKLRREIVGLTVGNDYFPTPPSLAADVVRKADIRNGDTVLEPSAGDGQLANAVRGQHPDAPIAVIEMSSKLREILEAEGHNIVGHDFMEHTGPQVDRIVMNPPFSNNQDIQHVRHAFDLLKPGGRLVAIMSEHAFFGREKEAQEFRDWLDENGGTSEKNPEGAFLEGRTGPTTGVATRTVVIDKPADTPAERSVTKPPDAPPVKGTQITPEIASLQGRLNSREARLRQKYGDDAYQYLAKEAEDLAHDEWLDLTSKILEAEPIGTKDGDPAPLNMAEGDKAISDGVQRYRNMRDEIEQEYERRGDVFKAQDIPKGASGPDQVRKWTADNMPAGMSSAVEAAGIKPDDPILGTIEVKDGTTHDVYLVSGILSIRGRRQVHPSAEGRLVYFENGTAKDGTPEAWLVEIENRDNVKWASDDAEKIGNGEFDQVATKGQEAQSDNQEPEKPAEATAVNDDLRRQLEKTGVGYASDDSVFAIQKGRDGFFGIEYTSPDRKERKMLEGRYRTETGAIDAIMAHTEGRSHLAEERQVATGDILSYPDQGPTVEAARQAVNDAAQKSEALRKAFVEAKNAAESFANENDIFTKRRQSRWQRGGIERIKSGVPKATLEQYNQLTKAVSKAEAELRNFDSEHSSQARVNYEQALRLRLLRDENAPMISRLSARLEQIMSDERRNGSRIPGDARIQAEVERQLTDESLKMAKEMYPDATDDEAKPIAVMILGYAGTQANSGTPTTIDSLRQHAGFETRLQLEPVRRQRAIDAMENAGIKRVSGYHEPEHLVRDNRELPESFQEAYRNLDASSSAKVDAFIKSIPDALAKLDAEAAKEKAEAEAAEAERKRIEALPVEEAPQGSEWKPPKLSKKPGDRDALLKMVMVKRPTLPILSMMAVEKGIGRTTDLELEISMPVNLPDGIYTQPKGSKVWIKNSTPLDEFPVPTKIGEKPHKIKLDGESFRKGLLAVRDAQSTDATRYILNGVLLEVRGGQASVVSTDGRRLHQAAIGKVNSPDVQIVLPKTTVEAILKSNGQGQVEIKVAGKTQDASNQYDARIAEAKESLKMATDASAELKQHGEGGKERAAEHDARANSIRKEIARLEGLSKEVAGREQLIPESQVEITDGNSTIRSKLLEGSFPNYRQVIPPAVNQKLQVDVDRKALGQAVSDLIPFLDADPEQAGKGRTLKLTIGPKEITIKSDVGAKQYHRQKTVPVSDVAKGKDAEPIKIAMDADYLDQLIAQSDHPSVRLGVVDELSPLTLSDPDGKRIGVQMPMRMSARGESDFVAGQPRGIEKPRFDAVLADETRAVPFAAERTWAGRFDDADEMVKVAVESGEGQAAVGSDARNILEQFKSELSAATMDAEQRGIHDVFVGDKSEAEIKISDLNNLEYALLESGNRSFGAKHILFKHFGGEAGPVTAQEIVDMGRFIRGAVLDKSRSTETEHRYKSKAEDGATITVVLGKNRDGDKTVITFYSNRKEAIRSGTHNGTTKTFSPRENRIPNSRGDVNTRFHRTASGQVRAVTIGDRSYFFTDRYDNESQLRGDIREEAGHRLVNEVGGKTWGKIGFQTYRGRWAAIRDEITRNYGFKPGTEAFNHELVAKAFRDGKQDVGLLRRFMDAVMAAVRGVARRLGVNLTLSDAEIRNALRGMLEAKARGIDAVEMQSAPAFSKGDATMTPAERAFAAGTEGGQNIEARNAAERIAQLKARMKAREKAMQEGRPAEIVSPLNKARAKLGLPPVEPAKTIPGAVGQAVKTGEQKASLTVAEALREYDGGRAAQKIAEGRMTIRGAVAKLMGAKAEEAAGARKELVDAINAKLPEIKSRHMRMVLHTLTKQNITDKMRQRVLARIDEIAEKQQKTELISAIKAVFAKASESMGVDVTYRRKIKDLMDGLLFTKPTAATLEKARELADFMEAEIASGSGMDLTPNKAMARLLRVMSGTPLIDMSVSQLEDIFGELHRLATTGRIYQQAKNQAYAERQAGEMDELRAATRKLESYPEASAGGVGEKLPPGAVFKNLYNKWRTRGMLWYLYHQPMDVIFDLLDGAKHYAGVNYRVFKARLDNSFSDFRSRMQQLEPELADKLKELGLVDRFGIPDQQASERIGAYAIDQQATGRQKLLNRYSNGTPEDDARVNAMLDSLKLTDNEMAMYRWMRQRLDEIRPQIARVMKDVYNAELDTVEHYFPFISDWSIMDGPSNLYGAELQPDGSWATVKDDSGNLKKNVQQGFTMSRVGAGKQAVRVDAIKIFHKHMQDVNYYLTVGPTVKYLQELATKPEYKEIAGDLGQKIVREYLDTMARQGGVGGSHILRWVDVLRNNIGVGTLGLRLSSILIQPSSWFDGAGMIGGRWALKGAFNYSEKRWRDFIWDNMTEIHDRIGDDWAFGEASARSRIARYGFMPLQTLDEITAGAIAAGAYESYLHKRGLEVDFQNPDREALAYAQKIVRRTQASPSYKDQPLAVSRGALFGNSRTLARAIYQFQTFSLNKFSYMMHDGLFSAIKNKEPHAAASIMAWTMLAFIMEESVRLGLRSANLAGGGGDDDEDAEDFAKRVLQNYVQVIPWLGSTVSALQYNSFPAPVVETAAQAGAGAKSMLTAKSAEARERGALRLGGAIGTMAGVPGVSQGAEIARRSVKTGTETVHDMIVDSAKRLPKRASEGMIRERARKVWRDAIDEGLIPRTTGEAEFRARYRATFRRINAED